MASFKPSFVKLEELTQVEEDAMVDIFLSVDYKTSIFHFKNPSFKISASHFNTDLQKQRVWNGTHFEDLVLAVGTLVSEIYQTEIDFGSLPLSEKEFTITNANVSATSRITASVAYEAPTGKDLDELEMDDLQIRCGQAEAGSFKMFVRAADGSFLHDNFKINYSISN